MLQANYYVNMQILHAFRDEISFIKMTGFLDIFDVIVDRNARVTMT